LCNLCHKVLSEKKISKERIAIPWFHIIRAHPIVIKRYQNLFNKEKYNFFLLIYFKRLFEFTAYLFYNYILSTFFLKQGKKFEAKNIDLIIISHLLDPSHLNNKEDFYFGKLSQDLKYRGNEIYKLYLQHFKSSIRNSNELNKVEETFIFSKSLRFLEEFKIWKSILIESYLLYKVSFKKSDVFEKNFFKQATLEALSIHTQNVLRMGVEVNYIVKIFKAKALITPYEGHSFERILFSSAREANPAIKCLAYQHTGIFKHSNAIFRTYSDKYNPDFILTTGTLSRDLLKSRVNFKNIPILVLGSNRGKMDIINTSNSAINRITCLVLPEGFISECVYLFRLSLECALKMPNISFIWRVHPSIKMIDLINLVDDFSNLPQNIILSDNSLESDISDSQIVLYRGTSAIFKAISNGLTPVYLNIFNEISIDPLWDLSFGKITVSNAKEFIDYLKNIDIFKLSVSKNNLISKFETYCMNSFSEFDTKVFDKIFL
jgi:hypothetical protein